MMLWYWQRYHTERRRQRVMLANILKPFTGRVCLAVTALAIALMLTLILIASARGETLPQYIVTASDIVNVRADSRLDAEDTGDLYGGDVVTGHQYRDGWVLVDAPVEAAEGWVCAEYLTLKDMPTGRYTNTSGGRVRIRREPDGKPCGWLKAGGTVDVIRWVDMDGTAWAYTAKGYVSGEWLEVAE